MPKALWLEFKALRQNLQTNFVGHLVRIIRCTRLIKARAKLNVDATHFLTLNEAINSNEKKNNSFRLLYFLYEYSLSISNYLFTFYGFEDLSFFITIIVVEEVSQDNSFTWVCYQLYCTTYINLWVPESIAAVVRVTQQYRLLKLCMSILLKISLWALKRIIWGFIKIFIFTTYFS